MNTKAIIALLLLISMAIPAMADEVNQAKLVVSGVQGVENNWVSEMWDLNESATKPFMDVQITFIRVGTNNQTGWFTVTGSGVNNPALSLIEGADEECVRGTCKDGNNVTGNEKSIKLMLIDLKTINTGTSTTNEELNTTSNVSDNPIYAYAYYDRELPMAEGKVNNFNGEDYVKQTGWTTEGGVSEVSVYFKRKDIGLPMSITVKAESSEPKVAWSDRTAKYTINGNGKYIFTIKYEIKNNWGWKEEFTEVYTLVTTGMTSGSSSKAITSEAPYEANVDSEFIVTMSTTGTFEKQTGITVTEIGNRRYGFSFDNPGQYNINFKGTDGGSTVVKFNVKSSTPAAATTATAETTANQVQPREGEGSLLWYIILLVAILGLGWMLISRKKKSTTFQLHTKAQ